MVGWNSWKGKKVFIILRNGKQFQGIIQSVDINTKNDLIFITLIDKFKKLVTILHEEIELIKEEE